MQQIIKNPAGHNGQLPRHKVKAKQGGDGIGTNTQVHVIAHYPETDKGKYELERRVADVYADMINSYIRKLDCLSEQKIKLLDDMIESVSKIHL